MNYQRRSAPARAKDLGDLTVVAAMTAGFFLAIINYLWPDRGHYDTDGALLLIVSTILILGAALLVSFRPDVHSAMMTALGVLIVLGIAGTAFTAWRLQANRLLVLMVIALCGALVSLAFAPARVPRSRPRPRPAMRSPSSSTAAQYSSRR